VDAVRRRLLAANRLALVAMLALALMPGLSRLLAAARGAAPTAVVCTAGDLRPATPAAPAAPADGPCPYCSLGLHAAALPPAPVAVLPALAVAAAAAPQPRPPPFAARPWARAQPRAPPARA
jgi:hypothetical protein